ncbi:SH3 domain-containing protein [Hydrogenimonas thermophila]|uniref:SH3 domain-containing protein n=1 Tax=Hydrogenimonas thermophila TaxID=223786 RepID=UPI002936E90C|nr:SH3 domain-containing protein [Hydrogenimonas thermophila]WOE70332.1 SH3 domain-containing protein [Hydrogenimonas thermophila]WOE72849.1 SH3 domain-containing protein [Hydrogenimonas thermophila]
MIKAFFQLALFVILFAGCVSKEPIHPKILTEIEPFLKETTVNLSKEKQQKLYADFISHYYMPWQNKEVNATYEDITWAVRLYTSKKIYAENRLPLPADRLNRWIKNANYKSFNSLKKYAIVVHPSNLRVFPTNRPIFYNPKLDGEGYPFDYNQNSAIKAFTPLLVSHFSLDGGWAFVQSPFALGWIQVRDIAFISKEQIKTIMNLPKVVLLKEYVPIYEDQQNFLFYAKMATIFPFVGKESGFYKVLVPQKKRNSLVLVKSLIPNEWAKLMPVDFLPENVNCVAKELLGEPYGWGGMVEDRDCSTMTRDFFAPFGIWLPRNSKAQASIGELIDLSKMSDDEKEKTIIEKGIPFQTLIYLPGHIMLYIGNIDRKVYAMHNIWGIRTQNNGRYIIGKTVITDLHLGENLIDSEKDAILIKRIKSINIISR